MTSWRHLLAAAVCAAAGIALLAPYAGAQPKPIRIGYPVILSGPGALIGEPSLYPSDIQAYGRALWLEQYAGGTLFRDVVHPLFHEVFVHPKVKGLSLIHI